MLFSDSSVLLRMISLVVEGLSFTPFSLEDEIIILWISLSESEILETKEASSGPSSSLVSYTHLYLGSYSLLAIIYFFSELLTLIMVAQAFMAHTQIHLISHRLTLLHLVSSALLV